MRLAIAREARRLGALAVLLLLLAGSIAQAQEAGPGASGGAAAEQVVPAGEDGAAAEETPPELPAVLTDPSTPLDEFVLRLIPLTAPELAELADKWLELVKEGTEKVVEAQVGTLSDDAEAASAARERVAELTSARNDLFQRYSAVLDSWQKKGGDAATIDGYRAYRSAIVVDETRTADFRTLADQALNWATDRDRGVALAIRVVTIIAAFLALLVVARVVRGYSRRAVGHLRNLSKLLQAFLVTVIYWLTIAFGLMIVLSALGIDITPVFALIGGASFIIAFAMQDTLGNLAAGLMIMINRPFDEGDYVDIGGVGGTVKAVSIVSTTVTTPDNQVIVVPNSKVWGNVITNVTASDTRRVDLVFGIGYDDSIEDAQRVLEAVVAAHPMVLKEPEPVIRVNALGASSVDFICRPWVRSSDYWTVYWDLTRQVKERFDAEGISIPFPQTDMHVYMPRDERVPFVTEEGGATAPAGRPPAIGSRPPGTTGGKAGEAAAYASGDEGHDEPGGHTDDERS